MNVKVAIFSCPRYDRLLPGCIFFMEKYWPDCPWPIEIVTGHETPWLEPLPVDKHYYGLDKDWGGNARGYLSQLEHDELVLGWLEDYYLMEPVDTRTVQCAATKLANDSDIGYIRLRAWSDDLLNGRKFEDWLKIQDRPMFGGYDLAQAEHLLSLQPFIARAGYLGSLMVEKENAWQVEIRGTERARHAGKRMLGATSHPMPYCNMTRYGVWRLNRDDTTSRDWLIEEVGPSHPLLVELDDFLGGGLR